MENSSGAFDWDAAATRPEKIVHVISAKGERVAITRGQVETRIRAVMYVPGHPFLAGVNSSTLSEDVFRGLPDDTTTTDLDTLIAETAACMSIEHLDYDYLAARIIVTRLHAKCTSSFSEHCMQLYDNSFDGEHSPMLGSKYLTEVRLNAAVLDAMVDHRVDYSYNYLAVGTFVKSYLRKIDGLVHDRIQFVYLRALVGAFGDNVDMIRRGYSMLTRKLWTPASPTLCNACMPEQQLASCFLMTLPDSVDGIFDGLGKVAKISKSGGGVGLSTQRIRSAGSMVKKSGGEAVGKIPFFKLLNDTARCVDQVHRKGAFSNYIEPWDAEVLQFLDTKTVFGDENMKTRDLFPGLMMNDLLRKRIKEDKDWSLFCPATVPNLIANVGDEFERWYVFYENTPGLAKAKIPARVLFQRIASCILESGAPYLVNKDSANMKSNQRNLGTITSSNLCTEIFQFTSDDEIAVCILASVGLENFVNEESNTVDYRLLHEVAEFVTVFLNCLIDRNTYPVPEARRSALLHRSIGIGIQGLAGLFVQLDLPFASPGASDVNKKVMATIYHGALTSSNELAKLRGPYSSFKGSPMSKGMLQFDLWGASPDPMWDWSALRQSIVEHGLRNDQVTALMPTASTSSLMDQSPCFEPHAGMIFKRRVLSGEYIVVNKFMFRHMERKGLWSTQVANQIIKDNGSVRNIASLSAHKKDVFRTAWEISQKHVIDAAADRAIYVDQSQSMNLFLESPTNNSVCAMLMYAWDRGLKTICYYMRHCGASRPLPTTLDSDLQRTLRDSTPVDAPTAPETTRREGSLAVMPIDAAQPVCTRSNRVRSSNPTLPDEDECLMCTS